MSETDIVCISPVDGREFARRPVASDAALDGAMAAARRAQAQWRGVPLDERCAKVLQFLDALLAMNQEVVPELAQQMGRPVRYGGEFRGVEERTRYMVRIAEDSLEASVPDDEREGFRRMIKREPLGARSRHRAVELSLSHGDQYDRAGARRGQCGDPEARLADHPRRRALPEGHGPRRPAEGACSRTSR